MRIARILVVLTLFASVLMAEEGKINFMIGSVKIQKPGIARWENAKVGQRLPINTKIKTERESRCEISLPNGSVIKVMENTEIRLDKIGNKEGGENSFFSAFGELFFKVKKIFSRKFVVKTPVAVMSVRGTEFYLINSPRGNGLWVKEGQVGLRSSAGGKEVFVTAGKKSTVISGGIPSAPIALTSVEKKLLNEISRLQPEAKPMQKPKEEGKRKTEDVGYNKRPVDLDYSDQQPGVAPIMSADREPGDANFIVGGQIGAVSIDGKIHTQIGLRPEFVIGKLGIGMDLTLYFDENGNINDKNWQSAQDIINKFMYIRWARRGDPFYLRVGAINNYSMGYGALINHYSNTIHYPDRIRTGMYIGGQGEKFGVEAMVNDYNETIRDGGVFALRLTYDIIGALRIGGTVVYDRNQYKALEDNDDDGVPNVLDDFPDDGSVSIDTDGDGIPDTIDPDRDGNGYTDNTQDPGILNNDVNFDPSKLKQVPLDINNAPNSDQLAYSIDLSYPIVRSDALSIDVFADYSQFDNGGGWGATAPGFMGKIAFFDFKVAYRYLNKQYIPEYFNATYEQERVQLITDSTGNNTTYFTKRDLLMAIDEEVQGILVAAGFNIFNFVRFSAGYQDMNGATISYQTLRGNLDINTSWIPKITQAGAYYYDQNVKELFRKSPGAIMGVKVGYEIAPGAAIVVDYRQTFIDMNGDRIISGDAETIRTTNISTVIQF